MNAKTRKPSTAEPTTAAGRTTTTEASAPRKGARRTTTPKPAGESDATTPTAKVCGCGCGAEVKGRYRPGHDARHVSAQAELFVAATADCRAEILDRLEQELSPALMAKWQARVDRLTQKDQIVYAGKTTNGPVENPKEN